MGKKSNKYFNVSQGSYDSSEICELVGQFYSRRWRNSSQRNSWDDGLSMVNLPCLEIDQLRKQIVKVFAEHCLKKQLS